jgi:hypothetical protein
VYEEATAHPGSHYDSLGCNNEYMKETAVERRMAVTRAIYSTSQKFGHTYSFKGFTLFLLFSTM